MRVVIDIGHPAHVHFFREAIGRLRGGGHEVLVAARDKDVALGLLRAFDIDHQLLGPAGAPPWREYPLRLLALARLLRRVRPQVVAAVGGAFVAPAGRLAGVPSLVFTDTEHVALDRYLTYPLATRICTPYTFKTALPRAQARYEGLHELAYLSPAAFRPDPGIRSALGVGADEPYAVVRLVSWTASHDRGHSGLGSALALQAVERLAAHGRVFVSVEGGVPPALERHAVRLPPERMHHVLAPAHVYLGEGATMATEAGLLGTPSVYVSSLVGTMGNFDVLEEAGLVRSFRDPQAAVDAAVALMAEPDAKAGWAQRARDFAARHIDVPAYVTQQLLEVAACAA
jgi:predicted glycosyltransferase